MYIFNAHFSITVDEVKLLQGVKTKYTTGEITGGGGGGGGSEMAGEIFSNSPPLIT